MAWWCWNQESNSQQDRLSSTVELKQTKVQQPLHFKWHQKLNLTGNYSSLTLCQDPCFSWKRRDNQLVSKTVLFCFEIEFRENGIKFFLDSISHTITVVTEVHIFIPGLKSHSKYKRQYPSVITRKWKGNNDWRHLASEDDFSTEDGKTGGRA